MYSNPLVQWLWSIYTLVIAGITVWTAVLFFKRQSPATWWLLIGGVILALANVFASVIYRLAPYLGLSTAFSPGDDKSAYMVMVEIAWWTSLTAMLCFQAALWFVLLKDDDSSKRIAELEAALHESHAEEP